MRLGKFGAVAPCLVATFWLLALGSAPLHAVTYTWDILPGTGTAGDSLITGGSGNWNTTTPYWTTNGGVTSTTWVNGNNEAVFGGTPGTVGISVSGISANALTFNSNGYTLGSFTSLMLTGTNPTITVAESGHVATITNSLAGTSGMRVAGNGTLKYTSTSSEITGTFTLDANATLQWTPPTSTVTNTFAGTGNLILPGTNDPEKSDSYVYLNANNASSGYSGKILVRNVSMGVNLANNLGSATIETIGYSRLLAPGQPFSNDITLNSWGVIDPTKGDMGSLSLNDFSRLNGTITLARDSRIIGSTTSTIAGTITESGGARQLEFGGIKNINSVTLAGTTTHTGGTIINGSEALTTLTLDYSSLNSSKFLDSSNLRFRGFTYLTLGGNSGNHTEAVNQFFNSGFLTINRNGNNTARIDLGNVNNKGVIDVRGAGLAITTKANNSLGYLPGMIYNATELAANDGAGNVVAATVIYTDISFTNSTARNISSQAGSIVRLTGGSSSVGNLNVSATITEIGSLFHNANFTDVTVDLAGNRRLRFAADGEIIGNNNRQLTISNGTVTAGGANNTPGTLAIRGGDANVTIQAAILNNGTGVVSVVTAGTVYLANADNTFSGPLTVGGKTFFNGIGALGTNSSMIIDGGTLYTSGVTLSKNITVTENGGEVVAGTFQSRLTGVISGPGKMTYIGSPMFTSISAEGNNTYTGGTLILGTRLEVGTNTNAFGTGPVTIRGGVDSGAYASLSGGTWDNDFNLSGQTNGLNGTLRLENSTLRGNITLFADAGILARTTGSTIQGAITGPFTLTKLGSERLTLTGANTFTGGLALHGGILAISGSGNLANGDFPAEIDLGSALVYESSTDQILRGNITSGGTLIKGGSSTLTLLGASNSYSGDTTITAGKLLINGNNSSPVADALVNGGVLGGTGFFAGPVTVASGATLSPGASIESFATGAVRLNSGSTFEYEFDSASLTGDLLKVNGALTLTGSLLDLNDLAATSVALPLGTKLTLINYSGILTGTFADLSNNGIIFAGSNNWQINYAATTGGSNYASEQTFLRSVTLTTVAIPEPSTYALALIFLGSFLVYLKRLQDS